MHRDLKPANIMVSDEGRVKVLDFGLAKYTHEAGEGTSIEPGQDTTSQLGARGTPAYMSPEQAEGKPLDRRTDIFSLGIVLYQLATGKHPFDADSPSSTVSAILEDAPPPMRELNPELPPELETIVSRCLEKDRERRFSSALELRNELDELQKLTSTGWTGSTSPGMPKWAQRLVAAVGLAAGIALLTDFFRDEPVPRLSNPIQITRSIGGEDYPSWSPDGESLAFHLNTRGDEMSFDIWVAQLGGGEAVNRTPDHPGGDRWPAWSPDGSQIAFWSEREGGGYFVMSALGGPAHKVIARAPGADPWWGYWSGPQWSPDGRELAGMNYDESGAYIQILSLASGQSRKLYLVGNGRARKDIRWSPDGRYLAYLDVSTASELFVLRVEDQQAASLSDVRTRVVSPSWSPDGRYLYFASNRGGSMDLWRQRMERGRAEGDPERLTAGIGMTSAALSPDGGRVAYSLARTVSNVWRVPISLDRPATWADAEHITFQEAFIGSLDVSPDGARLALSSNRSGNPDLWVLSTDGGEMEQLTTDPASDVAPAWSPSGEDIAFISDRSGKSEVWVQRAAGGPARAVTQTDIEVKQPRWSPDGQSILIAAFQNGNDDIWIVSAAGGEPRPLITHPADERGEQLSPDGAWLVFYSTRSGSEDIWRSDSNGAGPELLVEHGYAPTWSRDGAWIFYMGTEEKSGNLWAVSVDGGTERPMTNLSGRRGGPNWSQRALAADGEFLYFIWQEDRGDIWVAELTDP